MWYKLTLIIKPHLHFRYANLGVCINSFAEKLRAAVLLLTKGQKVKNLGSMTQQKCEADMLAALPHNLWFALLGIFVVS
jgi:hypothetical protein